MTSEQPESIVVSRSQPGETLRKAREGRGLALSDVAAALNLSPVALQNLESGAFDRLPGHTFARGYIRAYAKFLSMDQELLVREFDQASGTDAKGSSVNSLGRIEEPARVSHGLLRLASLVLLAILVLAGFLWWQDSASQREDQSLLSGIQQVEVESADGTTQIHPLEEPEDQAVELAQEEVIVTAPDQATVLAEQQDVANTTTETSTALASSPAVVQETAENQAVTPVEQAVAPAITAPAEPAGEVVAASGEGVLSIHFTSNCWTQVSDASGKVLLSALRRPGQDLNMAIKLPLELRLGYVSGAQVTFNGKRVDMQPFTTGETARLKLGQ